MLTADNDYGGTFTGRTGAGRLADRAIIEGRGFTILEEEERAGQTTFFVHASLSVIQGILENPLPDGDGLVYHFFELPSGRQITAGLIREWINGDSNFILRSS
jgi:hypothetical protein